MIYEIAHQLPLVPLVMLGVVVLLHGRLKRVHVLLAAAFFVSWLGDSLAHFMGGAWSASYVWIPIQFGIVFLALLLDSVDRWLAVWLLAIAAPLSFLATYPGPELLVTILGSIAAIYIVHGPLAWCVYLYFGAGTVAYLAMIGASDFTGVWYVYQSFRAAALLALAMLVLRSSGLWRAHGTVAH